MNSPAVDILQTIVQRKREEIEQRERAVDIHELGRRAESASPVRGFIDSIERSRLIQFPPPYRLFTGWLP